ncbi:hypothetical protein Sgou_26160 [Streptomyces gougerotii]|uniref:Uncharacterized protein n=1 Tax=Streptomyces gougerotii TaxID=53448 RepID=A0A8H9HUW2_9ACTN|nr:hypothetical protein Sgou_26160 [Streptomyces gougerotii]GGU89499.1 hypothetical protein GCM10010227_50750 [Streptomyces gougerotii]
MVSSISAAKPRGANSDQRPDPADTAPRLRGATLADLLSQVAGALSSSTKHGIRPPLLPRPRLHPQILVGRPRRVHTVASLMSDARAISRFSGPCVRCAPRPRS